MSCCGGNCGCGSDCKCGNGCGGCKMYPDLEGNTTFSSSTETFIVGIAPAVMINPLAEGSEMAGNHVVGGTENGGICKCGDNCTCNPCNCAKS